MFFGYVGEYHLRKAIAKIPGVSNPHKFDDHDRSKKSDLVITYKGNEISIEVKSLQTNTLKEKDGILYATFQCDGSDSREVTFENGERLKTTCLKVGEFDILAVNLFMFKKKWIFAYALNSDLPRSKYKGYSEYALERLLASSMRITWPVQLPFTLDVTHLLNKIAARK